jgi:hypothetical protein
MYKEGRQIVVDAARELDGLAKDAQAVQKKAKGLFGFLTAIFTSSDKISAKNEQNVQKTFVKAVKKKKEPLPEFDENLIYAQVADALTKFFQAYNALKNYVKEQEELALHQSDEEGQETAIKLVIANLQMEKLSDELSTYMVFHVPNELKDLYTRVNATIGDIAKKQALARREEMLAQRRIEWQRAQKADLIRTRILVTVAILFLLLWTWGMMISLTHYSY